MRREQLNLKKHTLLIKQFPSLFKKYMAAAKRERLASKGLITGVITINDVYNISENVRYSYTVTYEREVLFGQL